MSLIFIVLSLAAIFWAADLIVFGISSYARRLGLSDYITGLVVVAMAASMPEVIASLTALVSGREEMLFGTILGTNMVHTALVTGTIAVVGKKMNVESTILSKVLLPFFFALMVPFVLILVDGKLGRIDGAILLCIFAGYLYWLWRQEKSTGKMKASVKINRLLRDWFIFLGSLVALLIAGRTLVFSGVTFASEIGIPTYFFALVVIGIGGALPDFAIALRSLKQGHQDIGVGDILGSIALEFLLFFGLVGLLFPVQVSLAQVGNAMIFLAISLAWLLYVIKKGTMTWKHGIVMLALYFCFITVEIIKITT